MFEMGVVADAGERCRCSSGELAGELQYLSERFWNGFSGVVGKMWKAGWGLWMEKFFSEISVEFFSEFGIFYN